MRLPDERVAALLDGDNSDSPTALLALAREVSERRAAEADEIRRLREFAAKIIGEWSWGHELDGGDVQDMAEQLGLLVKVEHDWETCADEGCPCEGGEWIYWLAWSEEGRAALAASLPASEKGGAE